MILPQFQDDDRTFQLMQNSWGSILNPLLQSPIASPIFLKNIPLLSASNPNVVNHGLGQSLRGWFLVRLRSQSTVWDTQDSNTTPSLTLNLKCSADVTVDLLVF